MKIIAVIPARHGSTRFPGKPLADIAGKTMIERIHEQVTACPHIDDVLIATDNKAIFDAAKAFGAHAVMTSPECPSGSDRVAEAVKGMDIDGVVNIQGDQVILDKVALMGLVDCLRDGCPMVTIATSLPDDEIDDPNCVKVVLATDGSALYFSRSAIPFVRNPGHCKPLKHIGIYGFSRETLYRYTNLEPSPLEKTESLEQLRALENGIPIKVIVAHGAFFEVNTPQDRERLLRAWQI
ncbi:MAG TPA: 3-deoxy-manno-octulosonate cytidylyltransferase [Deltaproteobacteria bacterium]|nr:3-deoxy-manno-octulosonate cytidylyltransferase [Deltaproteobacteria bacterium]